jgi:hypothetical protein
MRTSPRCRFFAVGAVFLGFAFAGPMAAAGDLQILYPLYSYPNWYSPSTYLWGEVAAAASTAPITAIINPDSGPDGPPNADYIHGLNDLHAAGVTILGYVYTHYGNTTTRPLSDVQADIDTYEQQYSAYGVSGIFLDEASTDPSTLSYYSGLYTYIKGHSHLTQVVTNPGTNIPEAFISAPTSDTSVIFEDTSGWTQYVTDSYVANDPAQRFAALVLKVPTVAQMHAAIALAVQRNVGYVFVTDKTTPNPYNALPSYWTDEINYIAAGPTNTLTASKGGPVPQQLGTTTYGSFGTPQTAAFAGALQLGKSSALALFGADGRVLLEAGASLPGLPQSGSVIVSFGQPSGDAALVTLRPGKGAITAQDNVALVSGLYQGATNVVAQTAAPSSSRAIKNFLAIDGNGTTTFFLASLEGAGVAAENNKALFAVQSTALNLLVRTGELVNGSKILSLTTLEGSSRTLADGRWRAGDAAFGVRLGFSDGEAIYTIPATAASPADWTLVAETGPSAIAALNGATIASFGLPGFGPKGFAVLATLAVTKGGPAMVANDVALITAQYGSAPTVLARKGDSVSTDSVGHALTGARIRAMTDPIMGGEAQVAFMLTASGLNPAEEAVAQLALPAIAYSSDGAAWSLMANVGAVAPGGGYWAGFSSLALSDGATSAPLFTGLLKVSAAAGVSSASDFGLWTVDSTGALRLLLGADEGITVSGMRKTVRTFSALTPAPGSIGAASGYDQSGHVEALATFSDGTQALLKLTAP